MSRCYAVAMASLALLSACNGQRAGVDLDHLTYQQRLTTMAENWRSRYALPGVWLAYFQDGVVRGCGGERKHGYHPANAPSINSGMNPLILDLRKFEATVR